MRIQFFPGSTLFAISFANKVVININKVMKLTLALWNVRTLLDSTTSTSGRPERRTALGAKELARYRVDIAALSETRLSNKSKVTEIGDGYTIFWNGRTVTNDVRQVKA